MKGPHGFGIRRKNDVRPQRDQLGSKIRHTLGVVSVGAVVDDQILTFDPTRLPKSVAEGLEQVGSRLQARPQIANARHSGLRRERHQATPVHQDQPSSRRPEPSKAADERPPTDVPYSIHSVTCAATEAGMVMPSASAVLLFMTRSNEVGWSTGRSAGRAPLRILST